ncbi:MAG: hypothetical protein ACR2FK_01930 [Sphingomicrobium sp.]
MGIEIAIVFAIAAMLAGGQSTQPGTLASCNATSLNEAAECLRTKLSEADQGALVGAQGGSAIRGDIDQLVRYEFRLDDSSSKVGTWLRKKGIASPMLQSSVIIEQYLAQKRGASLDLRLIAKVGAGMPSGTPPKLKDVTPDASQKEPQVAISREQCAVITKLPLDELGKCSRVGDKIKVLRKMKGAN